MKKTRFPAQNGQPLPCARYLMLFFFGAAEDLARRLGISRSQLYSTAITRLLDSFDDEAVTLVLN